MNFITLVSSKSRMPTEFNGIDFGHAHLGETLLRTQDSSAVEGARVEVLEFIATRPAVPPDEAMIAPRFTRMFWELERTFGWAHAFHRSLYDLFASGRTKERRALYEKLLANYLASADAITPKPLDHHGRLWGFEESRSFRDRAPRFNSQIWAYRWLQAAVYDVQLMGGPRAQRERMPKVLAQYHAYLEEPPIAWRFMPLMSEVAPRFAAEFPEAATIFDNLHMLHDNVDDILSRPDLYPNDRLRRQAVLRVLQIYRHANHQGSGDYLAYEEPTGGGMAGHDMGGMAMPDMAGPRPPSAERVLGADSTGEDHR